MTQSSTFSAFAESMLYQLAELLVAYGFSEAADSALRYAVMLAKPRQPDGRLPLAR